MDKGGKEIPIFASPLARFGVSFAPEKGDYIGRAALSEQAREVELLKRNGTAKPAARVPRRIVPIIVTDRGVVREGYDVLFRGKPVGCVTSGTMVPFWNFGPDGPMDEKGMRSIGLAYLDWAIGYGKEISILCRGKSLTAQTVQRNLDNRTPPFARPLFREA